MPVTGCFGHWLVVENERDPVLRIPIISKNPARCNAEVSGSSPAIDSVPWNARLKHFRL